MSTATTAQTGTFTDPERNGNGARIQAVDSLSMDPAVFEKLLLCPQTAVKYYLRRHSLFPLHSHSIVSFLPQVSSIGERPIAFRVLFGFGIALRPLFCCLMGWRGSNQQKMGSADM
jgi:hypothetical protein